MGNLGAASRMYQSAIDQHPHSAVPHCKYAMLLNSVGDSDYAVHHLQESARLDPSQGEVLKLLSSLMRQRGEEGGARDALTRAVSLLPNDAELAVELAESLMGLDGGREAQEGKHLTAQHVEEARLALESATRCECDIALSCRAATDASTDASTHSWQQLRCLDSALMVATSTRSW